MVGCGDLEDISLCEDAFYWRTSSLFGVLSGELQLPSRTTYSVVGMKCGDPELDDAVRRVREAFNGDDMMPLFGIFISFFNILVDCFSGFLYEVRHIPTVFASSILGLTTSTGAAIISVCLCRANGLSSKQDPANSVGKLIFPCNDFKSLSLCRLFGNVVLSLCRLKHSSAFGFTSILILIFSFSILSYYLAFLSIFNFFLVSVSSSSIPKTTNKSTGCNDISMSVSLLRNDSWYCTGETSW